MPPQHHLRLRPLAIALALAAMLGCGKEKAATVAPVVQQPPQIESVFPPDRSQRIPQDTPIWVQFKEALSPSTVNPRTVFLKIDAGRVPIDVAWDPFTRRILIRPREPLDLAVIYTVELAGTVKTAAGGELGQLYWWQFRTLAARLPAPLLPATQASHESPVAPLAWTMTEPSVQQMAYEIYAGSDSIAVAQRALPPVGRTRRTPFLPSVAWPQGARVYWMISALNEEFRERVDGPVSWFDSVPVGTPIDSITVVASEWASVSPTNVVSCHGFFWFIYQFAVIRWHFDALPSDLKVASVRMEISGAGETVPGMSLWYTVGPWSECQIRPAGPPFTDAVEGLLATSVHIRPDRVRLSSTAMAAHMSAAITGLGVDGYMLRSSIPHELVSPTGAPPADRPTLRVYYYPTVAPIASRSRR